MTNLEKFQEVFGIKLDPYSSTIQYDDFLCKCVDADFCNEHDCGLSGCPADNFWGKEYKEVNK